MSTYITVNSYLKALHPGHREVAIALRVVINSIDGVTEHIKWNSPSYQFKGFDRITFNTKNKEGVVKLVLHMDTGRAETKNAEPIMSDTSGLIQLVSDIRGYISCEDRDFVMTHQGAIKETLYKWLMINP